MLFFAGKPTAFLGRAVGGKVLGLPFVTKVESGSSFRSAVFLPASLTIRAKQAPYRFR